MRPLILGEYAVFCSLQLQCWPTASFTNPGSFEGAFKGIFFIFEFAVFFSSMYQSLQSLFPESPTCASVGSSYSKSFVHSGIIFSSCLFNYWCPPLPTIRASITYIPVSSTHLQAWGFKTSVSWFSPKTGYSMKISVSDMDYLHMSYWLEKPRENTGYCHYSWLLTIAKW